MYAVGGVSALDACCTCGGGGLFVSGTAGVYLSTFTMFCRSADMSCIRTRAYVHVFFRSPISVCLLRTSWSQASASTTRSSLTPLVSTATTGWDTSATGVASANNRIQTCAQTAVWPAIYAHRCRHRSLRHCPRQLQQVPHLTPKVSLHRKGGLYMFIIELSANLFLQNVPSHPHPSPSSLALSNLRHRGMRQHRWLGR